MNPLTEGYMRGAPKKKTPKPEGPPPIPTIDHLSADLLDKVRKDETTFPREIWAWKPHIYTEMKLIAAGTEHKPDAVRYIRADAIFDGLEKEAESIKACPQVEFDGIPGRWVPASIQNEAMAMIDCLGWRQRSYHIEYFPDKAESIRVKVKDAKPETRLYGLKLIIYFFASALAIRLILNIMESLK